MKWVKSVVLTAAMAVVAYGVWSTLTRGPKKDQDNAALSSAPPFKKKDAEDKAAHDTVVAPSTSDEKAPPSLNEQPPDSEFPIPPIDDAAKDDAGTLDPTKSAEGTLSAYTPSDPGVASGVAVAADHTPADPFSTSIPGSSNTQPTATDAEYELAMQQVQSLLQQGRLGEAHMDLSQWYLRRGELSEPVRQEMIDLLDRLSGTVVYSQQHHLQPAHTVMEGETPEQIAAKYNVPWELLAKINNKPDPASVRPGDQLKVITGPFSAEVDTQSYELVVYLPGGRYAGRFLIGVGRELPTQVGEFVVTLKIENPKYTTPEGTPIPGGDPANPLGKLLLQVDASMGIHGTNDAANLGKQCEKGCISLGEREIDDVYDILAKGSKVKIVR